MWKPNNLKQAYCKCCSNCIFFVYLNVHENVCTNIKNYVDIKDDVPYFWHPVEWYMNCDNWEECIPNYHNV